MKLSKLGIVMVTITLLFILIECIYSFVTCSEDAFHLLRVISYISFSGVIMAHVLSKIKTHKEEKTLLEWNINLLNSSIDALRNNFTVFDKDLKVVYTNFKILSDYIEKEKLRLIKTRRISEVLDSLPKVYEIEEKLKYIIESKIDEKFIVLIDEKQYMFDGHPVFDEEKNVVAVVCLTTEIIDKSSIINI